MWPKALAQLIELAPHLTRLLPMADRFLQSKSSDLEASRTALEQMSEGLRGDLGQVTASHAGLYRQLNDQSQKLTALAEDLRTNQASIEALEECWKQIECRMQLALRLLIGVSIASGLGLVLLVLLIVKLHH